MKIGNPDNSKLATGPLGGERVESAKAKVQDSATGITGEPSATVDLAISSAARLAAAAGAEFDTAKVERIAQAIRDGSYKIDAEAIADKLIANANEVLGRVKSS